MELARIIKPAHPAELNIRVLRNEEIKRTSTPEGIPETRAAKKTGISEKLSFKKGNAGKRESLPKKPSIKDITINIELYTVVKTLLCLMLNFSPLSNYTKY